MSQRYCHHPQSQNNFCITTRVPCRAHHALCHARTAPCLTRTVPSRSALLCEHAPYRSAVSRPKIAPLSHDTNFVSRPAPGQEMCARALPHSPCASRSCRGLIRPYRKRARPCRGACPPMSQHCIMTQPTARPSSCHDTNDCIMTHPTSQASLLSRYNHLYRDTPQRPGRSPVTIQLIL